jgi:hypothetical protein
MLTSSNPTPAVNCMRNIYLLIFFMIATAIVSCSKKADLVENIQSDKLYDVKFSVSTFNTEIVGLGVLSSLSIDNSSGTTVTNALGDQIASLEYVIYNSSGVMVKNATQANSLATFGSISEQLPAGDYKMYIVGSTTPFNIIPKENISQLFITPSIYNIGDWFVKTIDLKVTEQMQLQNLILDRVVGKIEVQITDAIPANTAKITLSSTSASWIHFSSPYERSTEVRTVETILSSADIGKTDYKVSSFVIPLTTGSITSDVSIRAYNASGSLIADKIVKDVKVEKNKKTIMTGKLFTSTSSTAGLSVTVNADWNIQTNNITF